MDKAALLALAARCEAASGPDRELDAEIAKLLGRTIPLRDLRAPLGGQPEWVGGLSSRGHYLPFFSDSLDAALSLVPEGWHIWSFRDLPDVGTAQVILAGPKHEPAEATGKTRAATLCSAALRARAALA